MSQVENNVSVNHTQHDVSQANCRPSPPDVPVEEGWSISHYPEPEKMGESFNEYQIEVDNDDVESPFGSDEDAMHFVAKKAKEGSVFHVGVLGFLAEHCPKERAQVLKVTGY